MSGGGARGAYEVGVLRWLLDVLPKRLGHAVPLEVVTGTSVGGIHACYVAATLGQEGAGERLAEIWRGLEMSGVYEFGVADVLGLPFRLLGLGTRRPATTTDGVERMTGLLDTRPLERMVAEVIPWAALRRNVDEGRIHALAVTATEIASGRSIVWVDNRQHAVRPWIHDPWVIPRVTEIGPTHALASAAIPFLFPALRVGDGFFCDGGLRLNTPLAPALRLGADRLLIIGLRHVPTVAEDAEHAPEREASYGSLTYLTGKVLNALLLDHVDYDVDRLRLVNAILDTGVKGYGDGFLPRINEVVEALRGNPYRVVRNVYLQPSKDLGMIASECIDHQRPGGSRAWLTDAVMRYAVRGIVGEADLLSYLLFDRCYADHLIELGYADADARGDELLALFAYG